MCSVASRLWSARNANRNALRTYKENIRKLQYSYDAERFTCAQRVIAQLSLHIASECTFTIQ